MRILLVLSQRQDRLRVLVCLKGRRWQRTVQQLMLYGRKQEAFDLVRSRAEVLAFYFPEQKVPVTPELELSEY